MDAFVHIFYEVAGVSGAFATGIGLIPHLGNNYSFIITPIFFTIAGIIWLFIKSVASSDENNEGGETPMDQSTNSNYFKAVLKGFILFGQSVVIGAKIIFTHRKFIWLLSCYSLTLYSHRYLENGIAPQLGKRYLGNSEWSQIIVGGSTFGELLGAICVFIFGNFIKSPLPWSRLDALVLLIACYFPFCYPPLNDVKYTWIIALTYIPVGFGSAADGIALNSYIQSSLSHGSVRPAILYTASIQMTIISIIVFVSTFIPRGAIALNPRLESDEDLNNQTESSDEISQKSHESDTTTVKNLV